PPAPDGRACSSQAAPSPRTAPRAVRSLRTRTPPPVHDRSSPAQCIHARTLAANPSAGGRFWQGLLAAQAAMRTRLRGSKLAPASLRGRRPACGDGQAEQRIPEEPALELERES